MFFTPNVLLPRGGTAPWTPASIPGLQLWLEADQGVVESGGTMVSWTDQSPNAAVFAINGGAALPTWSATAFNSASPGVVFGSGSTDSLTSSFNMAATSTLSIIIVGTLTGTQYGGRIFTVQGSGADYTLPAFIAYAPSTWELYAGAGLAGGALGSVNTPQSVAWTLDGTNAKSYLNEALVGSAAFSSVVGGIGYVPYIGMSLTSSPAILTVAEIIISNQVISSGNLINLSAYLTAKYGIPL